MKPRSRICTLMFGVVFGMIGLPASALGDLAENVTQGLQEQRWENFNARSLAEAQEVSFALHEANGTLADRITMLARYAGDDDIQRAISDHPAYLDLFLGLRNARAFVDALYRFDDDRRNREALLEVALIDPSREGLARFETVVLDYGTEFSRLVSADAFSDLVVEVAWASRDGSTADFRDWLHGLLYDLAPVRTGEITEILLLQGGDLRQKFNVAERWRRLERTRQRNPRLVEMLLGHRGVWEWLDDDRLIEALNAQLARFNEDRALSFIALVLGSDGLLVEAQALEEWSTMLPGDRAEFLIKTAAESPDSPLLDLAFMKRNDDQFWSFAADGDRSHYANCLLDENNRSNLDRMLSWVPEQLALACRDHESFIPGSGMVNGIRKTYRGVPLTLDDWVGVGADTLDFTFTVMTGGGSKVATSGLRAALRLGLRGSEHEAATTIVKRATIKISVDKIRSVIAKQMERRATLTGIPAGLPRVMGYRSSHEFADRWREATKKTISPCLGGPAFVSVPDFNNAMECNRMINATSRMIENAVSTEFIRCAQLPNLSADDPICQALFSPDTDKESAK